jgi:hypothetical protein
MYYVFQTKHPRKLAIIKDSAVEPENYVWIIIYRNPIRGFAIYIHRESKLLNTARARYNNFLISVHVMLPNDSCYTADGRRTVGRQQEIV